MSNTGKQSVKKETFDLNDRHGVKAGGQPSQQKHGFNKIVHSKPMDTAAIDPKSNVPIVEPNLKNDHISGGRIV